MKKKGWYRQLALLLVITILSTVLPVQTLAWTGSENERVILPIDVPVKAERGKRSARLASDSIANAGNNTEQTEASSSDALEENDDEGARRKVQINSLSFLSMESSSVYISAGTPEVYLPELSFADGKVGESTNGRVRAVDANGELAAQTTLMEYTGGITLSPAFLFLTRAIEPGDYALQFVYGDMEAPEIRELDGVLTLVDAPVIDGANISTLYEGKEPFELTIDMMGYEGNAEDYTFSLIEESREEEILCETEYYSANTIGENLTRIIYELTPQNSITADNDYLLQIAVKQGELYTNASAVSSRAGIKEETKEEIAIFDVVKNENIPGGLTVLAGGVNSESEYAVSVEMQAENYSSVLFDNEISPVMEELTGVFQLELTRNGMPFSFTDSNVRLLIRIKAIAGDGEDLYASFFETPNVNHTLEMSLEKRSDNQYAFTIKGENMLLDLYESNQEIEFQLSCVDFQFGQEEEIAVCTSAEKQKIYKDDAESFIFRGIFETENSLVEGRSYKISANGREIGVTSHIWGEAALADSIRGVHSAQIDGGLGTFYFNMDGLPISVMLEKNWKTATVQMFDRTEGKIVSETEAIQANVFDEFMNEFNFVITKPEPFYEDHVYELRITSGGQTAELGSYFASGNALTYDGEKKIPPLNVFSAIQPIFVGDKTLTFECDCNYAKNIVEEDFLPGYLEIWNMPLGTQLLYDRVEAEFQNNCLRLHLTLKQPLEFSTYYGANFQFVPKVQGSIVLGDSRYDSNSETVIISDCSNLPEGGYTGNLYEVEAEDVKKLSDLVLERNSESQLTVTEGIASDLPEGQYRIEVFADGKYVGYSSLQLNKAYAGGLIEGYQEESIFGWTEYKKILYQTDAEEIFLKTNLSGYAYVRYSENLDFTDASYQLVRGLQEQRLQLSEGTGIKQIYVQFKKTDGTESRVYTWQCEKIEKSEGGYLTDAWISVAGERIEQFPETEDVTVYVQSSVQMANAYVRWIRKNGVDEENGILMEYQGAGEDGFLFQKTFYNSSENMNPEHDLIAAECFLTDLSGTKDYGRKKIWLTEQPPAPTDFEMESHGTTFISLGWKNADDTSGLVNGYEIYRDGVKLADLPIDVNRYKDENLEASEYSYCIYAVDYFGRRSEAGELQAATASLKVSEIEGLNDRYKKTEWSDGCEITVRLDQNDSKYNIGQADIIMQYREQDATDWQELRLDYLSGRGSGVWDVKNLPEGNYLVRFLVHDSEGTELITNEKAVAIVGDTEPPVAVIREDVPSYVEIEQQFSVSGANSSDNVGIVSYQWDFGDGSSVSGKEAVHAYSSAGSYQITLTVTDLEGNVSTSVCEVTAVSLYEENAEYTKLNLFICDAGSLSPIENASAIVQRDEVSTVIRTDADGKAVCIVPKNNYNVSAAASGYLARTVSIEAYGEEEHRIGLMTGGMLAGDVTVTPMTYDEIVAAGIDPDAPGNEQVFKFETVLTFVVGAKEYEYPCVTYKNKNGHIIDWDWSDIGISINWPDSGELPPEPSGGGADSSEYVIKVFPFSEKFILAVYGEAHWLKEMFNVELLILNQSNTDTFEDMEATLKLPKGLSLADMEEIAQEPTQMLGDIGCGEQKRANWYIRGDKEGSYHLTVCVDGNSQPYGENIHQEYTTSSPVKVYAGSAMHMQITCDDYVDRGEEYTVKYRLENVSDKPIYNFSFGIKQSERYKLLSYKDETGLLHNKEFDYGEKFTHEIQELAPGGYIEMEVAISAWFFSGMETLTLLPVLGDFVDLSYYLDDVVVFTLDGSTTTIPYDINIEKKERDHLIDKVVDEVAKKVFGDALVDGNLGEAIVEIGGKAVNVSLGAIGDALKLLPGETDTRVVISLDDGRGAEDSIYNNVIKVSSGTPLEGAADVLNESNLKINFGGIVLEAKGPGTADLKIGMENEFGEQEVVLTANVTVSDIDTENKITIKGDEITSEHRINADEVKLVIEREREKEWQILKENPYLILGSTLVFEMEKTESGSNYNKESQYEVLFESEIIPQFLNRTVMKKMEFEGETAELGFDREALETISGMAEGECTLIARRLSEKEAMEKLGNTLPSYQFVLRTDAGTITDFGNGSVYINLPYDLKETENPKDLYVRHIKDDGTIEEIEAEYDNETGMVHFRGNGFSYYQIMSKNGEEDTEQSEQEAVTAVKRTLENTKWSVSEQEVRTEEQLKDWLKICLKEFDLKGTQVTLEQLVLVPADDGTDGNFKVKFEIAKLVSGKWITAVAEVSGTIQADDMIEPPYIEPDDENGSESGVQSDCESDSETGETFNQNKNPGIVLMDEKKGQVDMITGIVTGDNENQSSWKQDASGWKLQYADGTFAAGMMIQDSNGQLTERITWELINGAWYAFGADGYMKYGWIFDSYYNGWFYVDLNTGMKTGWRMINGKWYYLNPISDGTKGILLTDKWIDEYYVNSDGVWEEAMGNKK